jgi:Cu2+-exporting ATPase
MSVAIADRAASAFVVAVLLIAGCTALYWSVHAPARALEIVLSVLVVSCPCALSLAAPTAMTAATTALKRRGFLVTRGHALDSLAGADRIILDKTGTLTYGRVSLQEVRPLGDTDAPDCLRIAASIESRSEHPIAAAFAQATDERLPVQAFRAVAGQGVEARIGSETCRLGRSGFAQGGDTASLAEPDDGKWVLLTRDARPLAWFRLGDRLRDDAGRTVEELRALKLDVGLLSGDSRAEVARTARTLGIEEWQSDCSPESKLASIRTAQAQGHRLIMVGDGINDVPVLSGADVSIAMANASDVTRANADCVLIAVELDRIPESIRHARLARRVIRQNVVWAIVYNLTAVPFAAAGMVPPWLAAIGMSASSLVVVGNALRLRASRQGMETRSGSVWTASTF